MDSSHTSASQSTEARQNAGPLLFFLDLLFPPCCINCTRVDHHWCPRCQSAFANLPIHAIATNAPAPLAAVIASAPHTGQLQRLIHALKYENATELAQPLAFRLGQQVQKLGWQADVIAAVPLHLTRKQNRGYNQSKLLAQELAASLDWDDVSDALTRTIHTRPQVGLNREARLTNVAGAFHAHPPTIRDRNVILIDDVMTTGATLRACAEALVAAGARRVYGLTLSAAL